jgi:hypothetical protein
VSRDVRGIGERRANLLDGQIVFSGDGLSHFARGEQSDYRRDIHPSARDSRLAESHVRVDRDAEEDFHRVAAPPSILAPPAPFPRMAAVPVFVPVCGALSVI